jgi:MFS family permease
MIHLLRHRDARVLLLGSTASFFGDWALFIVLAVWAKELTGSNAAAGMVFFVLGVPFLLAPLAGLLVDRVRKRPLMMLTHAALGLVVLALLFVRDEDQVWLVYAVAFAYGAGGAVAGSARSAYLKLLVPEELLPEANAAFQTIREGLRLFAPLAGAALYTVAGGGTVAIVDAATFAVSVAALASLRFREPAPEPHRQRFLVELTAGVRHVVATLPLRQIILSTAVALLVVGFGETLVFAVLEDGLGRPPAFFGVLSTFQGVGAIAGGGTAAWALRRVGDVRLVGIGMALFAAAWLSFLSTSLPVVLIGMTVAGAGISWLIVAFGTAIQLRTPTHLQGRVFSAADTMVSVPQTISIAMGAALSTLVDYRILVVTVTVVVAASAAYLVTRRTLVAPEPALAA